MLSFLPAPLRGSLAALLLALNTLFWCWPLFALSLLKLALPVPAVQRSLRFGMHWIAESWIAMNSFWMDLVRPIRWDVQGLDQVDMHHSYLVTSNHQSWADILVLQYQLNRRMPFLKFFLKQELIWVPVIGLCWWALEFPFMKRFSKEYLAKHPEKRGEDLASTRRACERYRTNPVSVFNFLEGTRFTEDKHAEQASPYRHLLAEGRRHRFRHRRHGRAAVRADQHHHPLPGRSPQLLGPLGRQYPSGRGTGRGTADPCRVPAPELRSGRVLPPGLPAVGQPAVDRKDAQLAQLHQDYPTRR